jgi:hypothetical protein
MITALLKRLRNLADHELFSLSEAIEIEMRRREVFTEEGKESARHRAIEREQSYRRRTGAFAPPVRAIGLKKFTKRRRAA